MNDYIYTDSIGRSLAVTPQKRPNGETVTYISANDPGVIVADEDAPAIALAILEAAGIEYVTMAEACNPAIYISPERLAVTRLQEWKRLHDKRAEREAEDAKVREFRESSLSAIASVFNESNVDAKEWVALSGTGRESWYARYRAARKFFEES